MRRIKLAGVLGQARGPTHLNNVDGSIQKEFGWGYHSFATGFVTYKSIMQMQQCAMYVSENALIIMSSSDNDYALSRIARQNHQEQSWELSISSIQDIQIVKDRNLGMPYFDDDDKERLRQRCIVYIKHSQYVLYIDTYDNPTFFRHLQECWQSSACAHAADVGCMNTNSNPHLAKEYLCETIQSFANSCDIKEKTEILEEISEEVVLDLEMKDAVFRHRELLVLVLTYCYKVLNSPSGYEEEVEAKLQHQFHSNDWTEGLLKSSARDGFTDDVSPSADELRASDAYMRVTYDKQLQQKLEQTVRLRLQFLRAALRFSFSLFFRSESVSSRANAVTEGDPLSPRAWIEVLAPDLFGLLCHKLQCNIKARYDERVQSRLRKIIGQAPSPFARKEQAVPFASDPTDDEEHLYLDGLVRSVADYQAMTMVELYRIAGMGMQDHQVGLSRGYTRKFLSRAHLPLGDLWVRQRDFDTSLENILRRIATLLDDIVLTERYKLSSSATGATTFGRRAHRDNEASPKALPLLVSQVSSDSVGEGKLSEPKELKPPEKLRRQPSVPPSPTRGKPPSPHFFGSDTSTDLAPPKPSRESSAGIEERFKRKGSEQARASSPGLLKPARSASPARTSQREPTKSVSFEQTPMNIQGPTASAQSGKVSALETQEILLHYYCQLLRQLTYDSAKAREVLGSECQSLWPPIIVILDIICPRQEDTSPTSVQIAEPPKNVSNPSSGKEAGRGLPRFINSCWNRKFQGIEVSSETIQYQSYISEAISISDAVDKKHSKSEFAWCPVSQYGPPRVRINKDAWLLLIQCRRCVEECMNVLELHKLVPAPATWQRYTATSLNGKVVLQEFSRSQSQREIVIEHTPRLDERERRP